MSGDHRCQHLAVGRAPLRADAFPLVNACDAPICCGWIRARFRHEVIAPDAHILTVLAGTVKG